MLYITIPFRNPISKSHEIHHFYRENPIAIARTRPVTLMISWSMYNIHGIYEWDNGTMVVQQE